MAAFVTTPEGLTLTRAVTFAFAVMEKPFSELGNAGTPVCSKFGTLHDVGCWALQPSGYDGETMDIESPRGFSTRNPVRTVDVTGRQFFSAGSYLSRAKTFVTKSAMPEYGGAEMTATRGVPEVSTVRSTIAVFADVKRATILAASYAGYQRGGPGTRKPMLAES